MFYFIIRSFFCVVLCIFLFVSSICRLNIVTGMQKPHNECINTKFSATILLYIFLLLLLLLLPLSSIDNYILKLIRLLLTIYSLTWNYLNCLFFFSCVHLLKTKNALRCSLMLCAHRGCMIHSNELSWAEPSRTKPRRARLGLGAKRSALGLYLMTNSNLNLFITEMGTMHRSQAIYITACSLFPFVLCLIFCFNNSSFVLLSLFFLFSILAFKHSFPELLKPILFYFFFLFFFFSLYFSPYPCHK